jgi:hypothetical protein
LALGSKFLGWLATLSIILAVSWFFLPVGYETLIAWWSPQLGNWLRPLIVMMNVLLVNPLSNFTMLAVWGIAGLIGGILAGTKKGAFVVGFMVWLSVILMFVFSIYMLITSMGGLDAFGTLFATLPPLPPGTSIAEILGTPIVQMLMDLVLSLAGSILGGGGGGGLDASMIMPLLMQLAIYVFTPVIVVIITGMIGATLRPKE